MSRFSTIVLFIVATMYGISHGAAAQTAGDVSPDQVAEMASIFDRYCLRAFPNDSARSVAAQDRAVPMQAAQLQGVLHDDPGHGWVLRTAVATYIITIEHPPVQACAVRRMTSHGVDTVRWI